MLEQAFKVESFATSDVGLVRKNNEDVFREMPREQFFIVADGMGGHRAGEVAAAKAVDYMCRAVQTFFLQEKKNFKSEHISSHMGALIENTNLWVHHLGSSDPNLKGMGTTLCSILFFNQKIIFSHVGDSRIYRFRNKRLSQLTKDHSVTRNVTLPPSTSSAENQNHVSSIQKRVLSQAIGTSLVIKPEVQVQSAQKGDIYILCSDGLSDFVPGEEIEKIIRSSENLNVMSKTLVAKAKEGGGHDNITILLLSVKS